MNKRIDKNQLETQQHDEQSIEKNKENSETSEDEAVSRNNNFVLKDIVNQDSKCESPFRRYYQRLLECSSQVSQDANNSFYNLRPNTCSPVTYKLSSKTLKPDEFKAKYPEIYERALLEQQKNQRRAKRPLSPTEKLKSELSVAAKKAKIESQTTSPCDNKTNLEESNQITPSVSEAMNSEELKTPEFNNEIEPEDQSISENETESTSDQLMKTPTEKNYLDKTERKKTRISVLSPEYRAIIDALVFKYTNKKPTEIESLEDSNSNQNDATKSIQGTSNVNDSDNIDNFSNSRNSEDLNEEYPENLILEENYLMNHNFCTDYLNHYEFNGDEVQDLREDIPDNEIVSNQSDSTELIGTENILEISNLLINNNDSNDHSDDFGTDKNEIQSFQKEVLDNEISNGELDSSDICTTTHVQDETDLTTNHNYTFDHPDNFEANKDSDEETSRNVINNHSTETHTHSEGVQEVTNILINKNFEHDSLMVGEDKVRAVEEEFKENEPNRDNFFNYEPVQTPSHLETINSNKNAEIVDIQKNIPDNEILTNQHNSIAICSTSQISQKHTDESINCISDQLVNVNNTNSNKETTSNEIIDRSAHINTESEKYQEETNILTQQNYKESNSMTKENQNRDIEVKTNEKEINCNQGKILNSSVQDDEKEDIQESTLDNKQLTSQLNFNVICSSSHVIQEESCLSINNNYSSDQLVNNININSNNETIRDEVTDRSAEINTESEESSEKANILIQQNNEESNFMIKDDQNRDIEEKTKENEFNCNQDIIFKKEGFQELPHLGTIIIIEDDENEDIQKNILDNKILTNQLNSTEIFSTSSVTQKETCLSIDNNYSSDQLVYSININSGKETTRNEIGDRSVEITEGGKNAKEANILTRQNNKQSNFMIKDDRNRDFEEMPKEYVINCNQDKILKREGSQDLPHLGNIIIIEDDEKEDIQKSILDNQILTNQPNSTEMFSTSNVTQNETSLLINNNYSSDQLVIVNTNINSDKETAINEISNRSAEIKTESEKNSEETNIPTFQNDKQSNFMIKDDQNRNFEEIPKENEFNCNQENILKREDFQDLQHLESIIIIEDDEKEDIQKNKLDDNILTNELNSAKIFPTSNITQKETCSSINNNYSSDPLVNVNINSGKETTIDEINNRSAEIKTESENSLEETNILIQQNYKQSNFMIKEDQNRNFEEKTKENELNCNQDQDKVMKNKGVQMLSHLSSIIIIEDDEKEDIQKSILDNNISNELNSTEIFSTSNVTQTETCSSINNNYSSDPLVNVNININSGKETIINEINNRSVEIKTGSEKSSGEANISTFQNHEQSNFMIKDDQNRNFEEIPKENDLNCNHQDKISKREDFQELPHLETIIIIEDDEKEDIQKNKLDDNILTNELNSTEIFCTSHVTQIKTSSSINNNYSPGPLNNVNVNINSGKETTINEIDNRSAESNTESEKSPEETNILTQQNYKLSNFMIKEDQNRNFEEKTKENELNCNQDRDKVLKNEGVQKLPHLSSIIIIEDDEKEDIQKTILDNTILTNQPNSTAICSTSNVDEKVTSVLTNHEYISCPPQSFKIHQGSNMMGTPITEINNRSADLYNKSEKNRSETNISINEKYESNNLMVDEDQKLDIMKECIEIKENSYQDNSILVRNNETVDIIQEPLMKEIISVESNSSHNMSMKTDSSNLSIGQNFKMTNPDIILIEDNEATGMEIKPLGMKIASEESVKNIVTKPCNSEKLDVIIIDDDEKPDVKQESLGINTSNTEGKLTRDMSTQTEDN